MRLTIVTVFVVLLMGGIGVTSTRPVLHRQTAEIAQTKRPAQPIPNKTKTVRYAGISFTFDSSVALGVKPATILAQDGEQLCDIWPEYPSFEFTGYQRRKELCCNHPDFSVFPIEKFRAAVAPDKQNPAIPSYNAVDEEVRVLKLLLADKPSTANIGRFLGKARDEQGCGRIPFLPLVEACMAFTERHRYLDFKNGKGIFFLTQWDRETTQINNGWLEYCFQGITDDGKYYISAGFPVAAPFLPNGDEPEVVAWDMKNYLLSHKSKEYQDYARPVLAKLETLPADKFQPNLELLEQLIQSLEVKIK